jgi:hypothetical protein
MFDRSDTDDLDAVSCARALEAVVLEQRRAGARRFALVAQWADTHPPRAGAPARAVQPGAAGTPDVDEFTATELGMLLGTSTITATCLLRDVLDLRHRLPQIWEAVMTGQVEDWKARAVARATAVLTPTQCRRVETEVLQALIGLPYGRAMDVIEGRVIAADPTGHDQRRRAEEQRRYVAQGRRTNPYGLRTLITQTTAGDVARLYAMIDHLADLLPTSHTSPTGETGSAETGPEETADVRRAKALALLANPALACVFLARAHAPTTPTTTPTTPPAAPADDPDMPPEGSPEMSPEMSPVVAAAVTLGRALDSLGATALDRLRPRTVLYLHLSDHALTGTTGTQVARTEGHGALSIPQLRDWLRTDTIVVKPVIDLPGQPSVDRYEIPGRLHEALTLREPYEIFPYGTLPSRTADTDHTRPYHHPGHHHPGTADDRHPPDRTAMHNLGPLGRSHHRAKTFGGFTLHQPLPGLYLWRAPTGSWYRVDHTGTTPLGTTTPDIIKHTTRDPGPRIEPHFLDAIIDFTAA